LGVERYTCIDLNEKHGAIRLDLNEPLLDQSLYGQFDLVTDHGCGEHAFNIAEVYRTMHRLCRPGGLLVIGQNVHGEGNGYSNFDTAFFEGLAAANQYRILFGSYLVTPKSQRDLFDQFHVPLSWKLLRTLDWSMLRDVAICYVLQKQHDQEFQLPYQTGLLCQRQAHYGFRLQFLPHPPSRTYVPVTDASLPYMSTRALVRLTLRRIATRLKARA
jgi:SAM-dependent methyltransferase